MTRGQPNLPLLRGEAVADAGLGEEVARVLRVGLELAAQAADVGPEVVRLLAVLRPPHPLEERGVVEDAAGAAGELDEQLVLRRRQLDLLTVASDLPLG